MMTTGSQETSADVGPSFVRRSRRVFAIKVALLLVVFALAGLLVAQRVYHLGDQSWPCASRTTAGLHGSPTSAGIQACRP
jgi:hypothetical protein